MQLKDFILQNANVLLISPEERDYIEIQKYGFRHIQVFSSIEEASFYFSTVADLENYDIIMERNVPYRRIGRQSFYYMLWELNRNKHTFINLWKDVYQNNRCIINHKRNNFKSYDILLDTLISSVESLEECVQNIIKRTLPQDKKEMKVLLVGKKFEDWKKESLSIETSLFYLPIELFTISNFIKKSSKCDIVLMEDSVWEKVLAFDLNIIEKIQKRNCKFRIFATFKSENCMEEKSRSMVGEKIQLDYIVSDFHNQLDFLEQEYRVSENNKITKQGSIISVLGSLYEKIVFEKENIKLDLDFMQAKEFERLYYLHFRNIVTEWKKAVLPVTNFICFQNLLLKNFSNRKFFSIPKDGNKLCIFETNDKNSFIVENYVEGVLRGTVTISKISSESKEIWVQIANAKGNLNPAVHVGIYPIFYEVTENMVPRIEDFPAENAMYENIVKKATRILAEVKIQKSDTYQRKRYRNKK